MKIKKQLLLLKRFIQVHPHYLPLFIIISLLVFPFNYYFLNKLVKKAIPVLHKSRVAVALPEFSLEKLMTGQMQREYEYYFNENNPARAKLVKYNNQFYYSLFTRSLMYDSGLIIGKKGFLYEKIYVEQYLNLSQKEYTAEQFDQWAQDLKKISDYFTTRGKVFVYFLTPSKVTFYPEYLPNSYLKLIPENPRPDYYLKKEALKKSGVSYVDASEYLMKLKEKSYGQLLFPLGGTHWTMLGATLSMQKVINKVAKIGNFSLPPIKYSYAPSFQAKYVDKDLLDLCKLLFPNIKYLVPDVVFEKNESSVPLKMAIIGGSFTNFYTSLFKNTGYFSQVDHFYYLILNHYQVTADGNVKEIPVVKEDPSSYKDILNADVVILEENELLPYSNHLKELYFNLFGTMPG